MLERKARAHRRQRTGSAGMSWHEGFSRIVEPRQRGRLRMTGTAHGLVLVMTKTRTADQKSRNEKRKGVRT